MKSGICTLVEVVFCLVYDFDEINKLIKKEINDCGRVLLFGKVNYSNEPFLLDPIGEELVRLVKLHHISNVDDVSKIKHIDAAKGIGSYACQTFFHKAMQYSRFNEVRLVELSVTRREETNPPYKNKMLVAKPISIIIRNAYISKDYSRLIEFASKNNIPIKYI